VDDADSPLLTALDPSNPRQGIHWSEMKSELQFTLLAKSGISSFTVKNRRARRLLDGFSWRFSRLGGSNPHGREAQPRFENALISVAATLTQNVCSCIMFLAQMSE
jgi:hypothetical protein